MVKKIYLVIIALLVITGIIDVLFVHAHYHTWYHETPTFELWFGLVGAFVLMIFSLGLGDIFLWRTTCSILLEPEMAGFGNDSARLIKWLAEDGEKVKAGQSIAKFETDRGTSFTIDAPYDGTISKCFIDEMSYAEVGESVVDLTVAKHAIGHGKEEKHA